MKNKGEAGEYLCTIPPYGFIKDPDDKKRWVVDEEAADVVRRIFNLCLEGYGPSQIARMLETDKVLVPSAHWQSKGIPCPSKPPANPYRWVASTVSDILEKRDYLGHTVNFKTYKQSYKSKKKLHNPEDKQKVFEDTHRMLIFPMTSLGYSRILCSRACKTEKRHSRSYTVSRKHFLCCFIEPPLRGQL